MFNTFFSIFAVMAVLAAFLTAWPVALAVAFVWAVILLPFARMATFESRLARDIARL